MTIEALSLQNTLDATRPDATNNGRATIRFYVRGSSVEDIVFLKWAITNRRDSLKKEIEVALEECTVQSGLWCDTTKLKDFEKKFNEFTQSLDSSTAAWNTDDISILWQTATSLRALDDEFQNIVKK